MKTFLRVIYTKIFYRIPLKFLLILLAIWTVLFVSFSSADNVWTLVQNINIDYTTVSTSSWKTLVNFWYNSSFTVCFRLYWSINSTLDFWISKNNDSSPDAFVKYYRVWQGHYYCIFKSTDDAYFVVKSEVSNENVYWDYFILDNLLETTIPVYTSLECQTEYNLIPIEEVDQVYCESNNLCPAWWTPSDCPNVWISNLFINDIFHPGAFNIIMNIPEEISRDYAYTNSWYNFNLDIEWYNVDYEKMQSVIDLQSYKPTSEDFTQIVWLLAPYTKIIVFFVFLFIIWAWIKKPFKSKRL